MKTGLGGVLVAIFILVIVGCGDATTTFDPEPKNTLTETIPSIILPEFNFKSDTKYGNFSDKNWKKSE